MTTLHSLGFNGFGQTNENKRESTVIKTPVKHEGLKVMFASWETTILQGEGEGLIIWGYKDHWFDKLKKQDYVEFMFGSPNTIIGMLIGSTLTCVTWEGISFEILNVKQAVYCSSMESIFILSLPRKTVQRYNLQGILQTPCVLEGVESMCSSNTHVLFSTTSSQMPLYGLGSNRLSQLGFDFQQQEIKIPQVIEYFNELGTISSMDCGSFHTAVIVNGDVYTFGWNKDGRLGWGSGLQEEEDDDDMIRCGVFLDKDNRKVVEINAIKVVCGTSHTLVLDDKHRLWSCGSNKYHQLIRTTTTEYDTYFRIVNEKTIDMMAGDWNSFFYL